MNETALFPGPGYHVSAVAVIPRGRAIYLSGAEPAAGPVRHLLGYEPFTGMCIALGAEPGEVASSIASFGEFARSQRDAIRAAGLKDAAAVFVGNVLVRYRDDAYWVRYGDQFPSAGTAEQQYEVLQLLDLLMDSDDSTYRTCVEMIAGWADRSRPTPPPH